MLSTRLDITKKRENVYLTPKVCCYLLCKCSLLFSYIRILICTIYVCFIYSTLKWHEVVCLFSSVITGFVSDGGRKGGWMELHSCGYYYYYITNISCQPRPSNPIHSILCRQKKNQDFLPKKIQKKNRAFSCWKIIITMMMRKLLLLISKNKY